MKKFLLKYKIEIIVFIIYLIIGTIFTWPIILHFGTFIYGVPGDPFQNLWSFHNFGGEILKINVPFSIVKTGILVPPPYPILELWGEIFTRLFHSDIAAYNFIILISFPLSGLAMFLFIKEITKNNLAAFFAGLAFTFSPFHLARAEIHLNMVSVYWLIFFWLFLIKTTKNPHILNWALVGLFGIVTLLDNYQYGIFAAIIFVFFCIYRIIQRNNLRRFFRFFLVGAAVFFILIYIFAPWLIKGQYKQYNRYFTSQELKVYSAQPFYYFLPSSENPILGHFTRRYYHQIVQELGTNLTEQTLYLGWTLITLALIGLIISILRKKNFAILLFILALIGYYFSFASYIIIFGKEFKTPAEYIFPHFPYIRVYARFGFLVFICTTILAGIGLSFIIDKIRAPLWRYGLLIFLCLLTILEFINFPPFRIIDVSPKAMPKVYQWLQTQPVGIVAEYPYLPSEEPNAYTYLLWQRYHKMPLVFGAPINSEGENLRKQMLDLEKPETIAKLKELKVDYIIVHRGEYKPDNATKHPAEYNFGVPPRTEIDGLNIIYEIGQNLVYRVK